MSQAVTICWIVPPAQGSGEAFRTSINVKDDSFICSTSPTAYAGSLLRMKKQMLAHLLSRTDLLFLPAGEALPPIGAPAKGEPAPRRREISF